MLTEQQIQDEIRRRAWIAFPYLAIGVVAAFAYFPLVSLLFDPPPASLEAFLFIILAFPIFLAPILIGIRKAQRIRTLCPACHKNLNRRLQRVLLTRCCPECGSHIVEGAFRADALLNRYRRHHNWQTGRRAHWILVIFMLFPLLPFLHEVRDPNYPPVSWTFSLLMLVASAYLWFSTRNYRCVFPLLASLILFTFGFWRFWNATTP